MKKCSWSAPAIAAAALLASVSFGVHAETKGPVTDELGVIEIPKDAPIVIGGYWVISGPDTALGLDSKRGVEVAFDDIGNKIAGHEIQFVVEVDDDALAQAVHGARCPLDDREEWRIDGTQDERARHSRGLQDLADDPRSQRVDVGEDVR